MRVQRIESPPLMPLDIGILGSGQQALRAAGAIRAVPSLTLAGIWSRDSARSNEAASLPGCRLECAV